MEFLLLWADEIDDAMGVLRHLAPRALGLILAAMLLLATAVALTLAPELTLGIGGLVLSGSLLALVRRRRARLAVHSHSHSHR